MTALKQAALSLKRFCTQGFMVKVLAGDSSIVQWDIEDMTIATLRFAELYFSIGTRAIVAFGCTVRDEFSGSYTASVFESSPADAHLPRGSVQSSASVAPAHPLQLL